jgi:hypothetical protein
MLAGLVALFPGRVLLGHSLSTTANLNANYPWRSFAPNFRPQFVFDPTARIVSIPQEWISLEQIRSGIPPLWNPYMGNGTPLLATLMPAPFYPLKLLDYVLPFGLAVDVDWLLRLWLSGMGAFALARTLKIGWWGALLAGVTYMMSSSQLIVFSMPIPNVTALFPWILLAADRTITAQSYLNRWLGITGLLIGAQFLGGWPESSVYLVFATAIYAIGRVIQVHRLSLRAGLALARVVVAGVLGLAVSAIQLLPLAAAWQEIYSIHLDGQVQGMIPASLWSGLGVPLFIGAPGKTWLQGKFDLPPTITMLFVSSTIVVLALSVLFLPQLRSRLAGLLAVVGVMGWYFFGLPGAQSLAHLPLLNMAFILWGLFVLALCLAVLAGAGLDVLLSKQLTWRQLLPAAGIWLCLMAIGLISNWKQISSLTQPVAFISDRFTTTWSTFFLAQNAISLIGVLIAFVPAWPKLRNAKLAPLIPALVLIAVMGQLWYAGFRLNSSAPSYGYPSTPGIDLLKSDQDLFRISSIGRPEMNFDSTPLVIQSASLFGLYDARNHDAIMPARFLQFTAIANVGRLEMPPYRAAAFGLSNIGAKRYLDMSNVKYLLDFPSKDWPDDSINQQLAQAGWELIWDQDMRIYRNPTVMPRAYITHAAWSVAPGRAAERLVDPAFDPRRVTILEDALPADLPGGETTRQPTITIYEPLCVEVQADLDRPGLLVLSDTWFPGWRASLDGGDTTLYRANLNFRAVYVPVGKHKVVFWYNTDLFWLSAVISVVALAGCVGLIAIRPC